MVDLRWAFAGFRNSPASDSTRNDRPASPTSDKREGFYGDSQEGADVVEGASIVSALSSIVTFLRNIQFIGEAIGRFGMQFPTDPLGAIIGILSLILGTIVGLIVMIWYMLLTVLGVFWVLLGLIGVQVVFGWAILYTIIRVLWSVLITIPYLLMFFGDLMTGGFVTKMMRCENLPDDWSNMPNFSHGNEYNRIFPFCFRPCFKGYKPIGCFCHKRGHYMPDFCPQQQIYRVFRGMGLSQPYVFDTYRPSPYSHFGQKSLQAKQSEIVAAYRDKISWYQTCYQKVSEFDFINRHICNNVNRVNGLSATQRERLTVLCRECYCNYKEGDGRGLGIATAAIMTGEEERTGMLCNRLSTKQSAPNMQETMSGPGVVLLKRTLLIGMLVICVLAMFYSMLKASKQMASAAQES
jgi:hypothetical protein